MVTGGIARSGASLTGGSQASPRSASAQEPIRRALLAAGGRADHVHMAVVIPPKESVSQFVGKVKANSSGWLRETVSDTDTAPNTT